ncbi:hypothetical protein [Streptomyces sp. CB00455]|uniref:hypothetical protein n=1 Tax=Streptomyces sp. CB00455 TaxID=1703927 RepID=UPI001300F799|nr:hypothetical protein [Streptomyces sp. CB00455]
MEVTAERVGYWAAHGTADDSNTEEATVQFGVNEDAARKLMARFGRWGPYR